VLINNVRNRVEEAVRRERMSLEESRMMMQRYREGLAAYTYLEE
jgi:arginine decarboxylase-like protein